MQTIAESLNGAARSLAARSESPRLDAELLLGKVLCCSRTALIVRAAEPVTDESRRIFAALLEKRLAGEPVAYLLGTREFWSLPLKVTPAVLVPRPETELLVECALARLPAPRDGRVALLDLGTGSGAIALAVARERPDVCITAVDVSPQALDVARDNARALNAPDIDWRQGSWFDAVPGIRFDLIVANPPYLATDDPHLAELAFEPPLALTSGPTGLEALQTIIGGAAAHLTEGGWLLLEHGSTQAPAVAALLAEHRYHGVCSHLDGAGWSRVSLAYVTSLH